MSAASLLGPGAAWDPELLDASLAARHQVLPARDSQGRHWLLADRPADALLLQLAARRRRGPVQWRQCEPAAFDAARADAQATLRALSGLRDEATGGTAGPAAEELSLARLGDAGSPAVRLLDAVLFDALQEGASDVHLECDARGAAIRIRVDGVLAALRRVEGTALAEQMVSRLKVMAGLDIGERRLPQDGRFQRQARGRDVDFRLSIMPSVHGEDAVVRVLDRAAVEGQAQRLTLAGLGFAPEAAARIARLARLPHGMLLVTGPTGSGKTTTLYAAIAETLDPGEKLITIEDPVEYELAGAVQIPVNERQGLGFARGLRSILRHDPDRVMVGEIRDPETAQIAVQAALTGHGVFSTVHANGVFDVIGRFLHMGLDPYHVVSALNAVLAQRLLRMRCTVCGGPGCSACRGTGYRGRRALAELLVLDDELRDLIAARAPLAELKTAAAARGHRPLREAALEAVAEGWTTREEVDRVTLDA
jgi:general secretion pathway protein E